jgi:hypothetical protein
MKKQKESCAGEGMKKVCVVALCLMLTGVGVRAKETFAKYPVFFVQQHVVLIKEKALLDARQTALMAARLRDMAKLEQVLADKITVLKGKIDPSGVENDKFVKVDEVRASKLVRLIGELKTTGDKASDSELGRAGWFALVHVMRNNEFSKFEKLSGQVCNRGVGLARAGEFARAAKMTKSRLSDWLVAKTDMAPDGVAGETDSYDQPLSAGQMVWRMPDAHPDAAWTHVVDPATGKPLSYRHKPPYNVRSPYFSPYIGEHICFGKRGGKWKITAIALRIL